MAARSRVLSWEALIARLKSINGPPGGYWLDIGRRVYPKFVLPEDKTGAVLPWLCVPLVTTQPTWEQERDWLRGKWTQPIFGFVPIGSDKIEDTSGAKNVMHLTEDVLRAVFTGPPYDLDGTCEDVALVDGGDETANIDPTDFYGEFSLNLQITILLQRSVLGPSGT